LIIVENDYFEFLDDLSYLFYWGFLSFGPGRYALSMEFRTPTRGGQGWTREIFRNTSIG
jgi:hypothetical protein